MKDFEYYFFDLYHTLVRVAPYPVESERECRLLGISQAEWSEKAEYDYENRALGYIRNPDEIIAHIVRYIKPDVSPDLIKAVIKTRTERFYRALVDVDPAILETIRQLSAAGKKLTLISNADVFDIEAWPESPLSSFFMHSIFSCNVHMMKPDPRIYEYAMAAVNADVHKSVFIGDGGHHELAGAKKAGLVSVLTTQIIGDMWPEEIPALAAESDFTIQRLSELLV